MLVSFPPIKGRKVRIALVGCGRISKNHIKSICLHHERAEIAALCDISTDRLRDTIDLINDQTTPAIPVDSPPLTFTSYCDFLDAVKTNSLHVDLVVLTTPSGLHPRQTIAAANVGLNVCSEKPMATRWEDGLDMVNACDDAGVNLFVVKQNRFNSTLQLVKKQIIAGRFGRIALVAVNVFWQRPQSYYDQDSWRGTWEFDGGALMNQASHYIDLLDWLIGPVSSVSASTATIGRNIEVEDTAALQLKWRNGALGTMAVTMLAYPKNLEGSITILGDCGSVKIGGPAVNQIELWQFSDNSEDDKFVDDVSYQTTSVYGFGHPPYYSNMLDALEGKSSPLCDGRSGLKSLELLIAAYRSARSGETVHLPLNL